MRPELSCALLTVLVAACASRRAAPVETPAGAGSAPGAGPESGAGAAPEQTTAGGAPAESDPPRGASLPEAKVESVGMHIGGGSNDGASKEPFQRALARQYPELLRCYRLLEEPKSGTFGVDLHIPRGGGRPRVEQPRTALRGEAFRSCVIRAFENTEFEETRLPIVISYSVRFSLTSE